MNNFEKIEAYLEGWMTQEERAAFEAELQTNEALRKDYEDWLYTERVLQKQLSADEKTQELKNILTPLTRKYFKVERKPQGKVVSFKKYIIAAATAAAILIIFLSIPGGINNYQVPIMPQAVVRGAEDLSNEGAQLFNKGEYEKALPLLKQQAEHNPEDATIQYFYAIALIKTAQYEIALPVLERLSEGVSAYKEDAAFFTALAAYKLQRNDTALKYAQQVSEHSPYYKKAQKIIRKLN